MSNVVKVIGNAVGAVEERKGKLYQDKTAEKLILSQLQAGDILLEKTSRSAGGIAFCLSILAIKWTAFSRFTRISSTIS
jgi:hypothetical protein